MLRKILSVPVAKFLVPQVIGTLCFLISVFTLNPYVLLLSVGAGGFFTVVAIAIWIKTAWEAESHSNGG